MHWVDRILFFDVPLEVFAVIYTAFGAVVLASWFFVPPRLGTFGWMAGRSPG